jgi:hypothetical protein
MGVFKDLILRLMAPSRPTIQVNKVIKLTRQRSNSEQGQLLQHQRPASTNRGLVWYKWSQLVPLPYMGSHSIHLTMTMTPTTRRPTSYSSSRPTWCATAGLLDGLSLSPTDDIVSISRGRLNMQNYRDIACNMKTPTTTPIYTEDHS